MRVPSWYGYSTWYGVGWSPLGRGRDLRTIRDHALGENPEILGVRLAVAQHPPSIPRRIGDAHESEKHTEKQDDDAQKDSNAFKNIFKHRDMHPFH